MTTRYKCDHPPEAKAWDADRCGACEAEAAARLAHLDSPETQEAIRRAVRVVSAVPYSDIAPADEAALRGLLLPEPSDG